MQGIAQPGLGDVGQVPGGTPAAVPSTRPMELIPGDPQSAAMGDLWEGGEFQTDGATAIGDGILFTDPASPAVSSSGDGSLGAKIALVAILLIGGGFAYAVYGLGADPMEWVSQLWGSKNTKQTQVQPKVERSSEEFEEPVAEQAVPAPPGEDGPKAISPVAGNPYWTLPNSIIGVTTPKRLWTAEQEERWRVGITHKYSYQRYKTVQQVRRARSLGGESILWDALQDKKAWTRLFAAFGLAEYNQPLATTTLKKAVGDARSELVASFLERFVARPNAGQAYIMRQLVRLLDERGRLACLRAIWNTKDVYSDLYVAAATLDPGPRVRAWSQKVLLQRSMPLAKFDELVAMVNGEIPMKEFDPIAAKKTPQSKSTNQKAKAPVSVSDPQTKDSAAATSSPEATEEETATDEADDPGDIVFFDVASEAGAEASGSGAETKQTTAQP